jgi:hypothetical protein
LIASPGEGAGPLHSREPLLEGVNGFLRYLVIAALLKGLGVQLPDGFNAPAILRALDCRDYGGGKDRLRALAHCILDH